MLPPLLSAPDGAQTTAVAAGLREAAGEGDDGYLCPPGHYCDYWSCPSAAAAKKAGAAGAAVE
jgi:hypothetical protein